MYNYNLFPADACEFIEVADLEELLSGDRIFLEIDDKNIVLLNVAGKIFALEDICSHDNGPLGDGKIEGESIVCPRHGARFDIQSGKAVGLPAVVDIPAYPVRIIHNKIEIGLPK